MNKYQLVNIFLVGVLAGLVFAYAMIPLKKGKDQCYVLHSGIRFMKVEGTIVFPAYDDATRKVYFPCKEFAEFNNEEK